MSGRTSARPPPYADQRFESELTQPAIAWLEGLRNAS